MLVQSTEIVESIVEGKHIATLYLRQQKPGIEFDLEVRSTFSGEAIARIVHQNLAHEPRRYRQEVRAIVGIKGALIDQPQIGLVDQRGALQCVFRTLALQMMASDFAEFSIYEGNQSLEGSLIASLPQHEQFADSFRMLLIHNRLRPETVR